MIVTCPACDTRYNLPEDRLGATGRTIQCVKCQYSWFQPPTEMPTKKEGAAETPTAPIAPENKADHAVSDLPPSAEAETTERNDALMALPKPVVIGAGVLLIALIILVVTLLAMNPFAPQGPAAYRALTVYEGERPAASMAGMVLTDVQRKVLTSGEISVLVFTGKVTNTGSLPLDIPEIRVQLLDKRGVELDFWPAQLELTELGSGQSAEWSARFLNPDLENISEYQVFFHEGVQ